MKKFLAGILAFGMVFDMGVIPVSMALEQEDTYLLDVILSQIEGERNSSEVNGDEVVSSSVPITPIDPELVIEVEEESASVPITPIDPNLVIEVEEESASVPITPIDPNLVIEVGEESSSVLMTPIDPYLVIKVEEDIPSVPFETEQISENEVTPSSTNEWISVDGIVGGNIQFNSKTGTITDADETITSASIPTSINGVTVVSIGAEGFRSCKLLESVSLPNTITSIGSSAFYGCSSLKSISIPSLVTEIKSATFYMCTNLEHISLGSDVTSLGESIFYGCSSLTKLAIPSKVSEIAPQCFYGCDNLVSFSVGSQNNYFCVENGVLYDIDKTKLVNYPSAKADSAFIMPATVTSIENYAFQKAHNLTNIEMSNAVEYIGEKAFEYCDNLLNITIPDSVTYIGDYAFTICNKIENIVISSNVNYIGEYAFYMCDNLESIVVDESNPNYSSEDGVLFDKDKTTLLVYPCSKSDTSYEVPSTITYIYPYAFSDCVHLEYISIPNSVTEIGEVAFARCYSLEKIDLPETITSLEFATFYYCRSLNTITIPNGIVSIKENVFGYCYNLNSIVLSASVKEIGTFAFSNCTSLTTVYFSGSNSDWASINISNEYDSNSYLMNANFEYNISLSENGKFDATNMVIAELDSAYYVNSFTEPFEIDNVIVSFRSLILEEGIDYELSYLNNDKAGTATLIVTGIGLFEGVIQRDFEIKITVNSLEASVDKESVVLVFLNKNLEPITNSDTNISIKIDNVVCIPSEFGFIQFLTNGRTTVEIEFTDSSDTYFSFKKTFSIKSGTIETISLSNRININSVMFGSGDNAVDLLTTKEVFRVDSTTISTPSVYVDLVIDTDSDIILYEIIQDSVKEPLASSKDGTFELELKVYTAFGLAKQSLVGFSTPNESVYIRLTNRDYYTETFPLAIVIEDSTIPELATDFGITASGTSKFVVTLPSSIPLVGGANLEMDLKKIPIIIYHDGYGKITAAINLDTIAENGGLSSKPYTEISETIQNALNQSIKDTGKEVAENSSSISFTPTLIGLISGYVDYNGNVVGELHIYASGKAKWEAGATVYIPIGVPGIPIALNLETMAEISATIIGGVSHTQYTGWQPILTSKLGGSASITPSIGIGWRKGLSAGVYGQIQASMSVDIARYDESYAKLVTSTGLYAEFTIFRGELEIAKGTYEKNEHGVWAWTPEYIWDDFNTTYSLTPVSEADVYSGAINTFTLNNLYEIDSFEITDRSYLYKPKTFILDAETVASNVFDNAQPQLVISDGVSYMFWLNDVGLDARSSENRTALVFSKFDNSTKQWESPVQIFVESEESTADFDFNVTVSDDDVIHIVLMKSTKIFDKGTGLSEILSSQDIYYTNIKNGTVSEGVNITKNSLSDTFPEISNNGSLIAWIENSEPTGNVFAESNKQTIKYVNTEDITGIYEIITLSDIVSFTIGEMNGIQYLVYSAAEIADDGSETANIYLVNLEDKTTKKITDIGFNSNIMLENGTLYWLFDGDIYYTANGTDINSCGLSNVNSTFTVITGDDETKIVWQSAITTDLIYDENTGLPINPATAIYASDLVNGKFSSSYKLCDTQNEVPYGLSGYILSGQTYLGYSETIVDTDYSKDSIFTSTNIKYVNGIDIPTTSEIVYVDFEIDDLFDESNTMPITLTITNIGGTTITTADVYANETFIGTISNLNILAGETQDIVLENFTKPITSSDSAEYSLSLSHSENTFALTVPHIDLKITVENKFLSGHDIADILVTNSSQISTSAKVKVYADIDKNDLVKEYSIDNISSSENYNILLSLSSLETQLDRRIDAFYFVVEADNTVTETSLLNNNDFIYLGLGRTAPTGEHEFTISFDSQGGDLDISSMQTDSQTGKLSSLPIPVKTDYTFDGWYTETTEGIEVTTSYEFNGDTTIYAQWTKNKTDSGSGDNGSGDTGSGGTDSDDTGSGGTDSDDTGSGGTDSGDTGSGGTDSGDTGSGDTNADSSNDGSSSTSTSTSTTTYTNTLPTSNEGTITMTPTNPKSGDTVTLEITPNDGYEVSEVFVKRASTETEIEVTLNEDGTYSFTQPSGTVIIEVIFAEKETTSTIIDLPIINNMTTSTFNDMTDLSIWYYDPVKFIYDRGLMAGTSANTFSPNLPTDRGMFVTILYSLAGKPEMTSANYTDVLPTDYFSDAVAWASSVGIATGTGNNQFSPDKDMTREEMMVMLYAYEKIYGDGGFTGMWSFPLDFSDSNDICDWAYEATAWCSMKGIVSGKGEKLLDPKGSAKRCEVAQILKNFIELYS